MRSSSEGAPDSTLVNGTPVDSSAAPALGESFTHFLGFRSASIRQSPDFLEARSALESNLM
jgi:hypothetical protein